MNRERWREHINCPLVRTVSLIQNRWEKEEGLGAGGKGRVFHG